MLEAVDLACQRGRRTLFAGLSFAVAPGACLHVAGTNGAGKTSLLRLLCGLLLPAAGVVRWRGRDIRALREEFWSELAYVGHANGVKDDLTALENVQFGHAVAGRAGDAAAARQALTALGLGPQADRPTRLLSQGQRRRVALARLVGTPAPPLWILDEPFTALDAAGVEVLRALIAAQLAGGGMVVFTTHQDVPLAHPVRRLDLDAAVQVAA